jgi:hypothetical protein
MKNPRLTLTQQNWTGKTYDDDALAQVVEARWQLFAYEVALRERVEEARTAGYTWSQIGDVMGTTRQAAQQRFGD